MADYRDRYPTSCGSSPDRDGIRNLRNDRDVYNDYRGMSRYNRDTSPRGYRSPHGTDRRRKRYRSRSQSRSRSRSRGSSSSYSYGRRSPKNERRHHKDRYRHRSPSYDSRGKRRDSDSSRNSDSRVKDDWLSHVWSEGYRSEIAELNSGHVSDGQDSQERRSFRSQSPNRTLIVRNLSLHISESNIREFIDKTGVIPKDVRLIRKKETGCPRGLAFIEFYKLSEAVAAMESCDGELRIENYRVPMQYSIQKEAEKDISVDWYCKCSALNFKRREHCYRCGSDRKNGERAETDEVSSHPTHTVILKGLDILTTEEDVLKAIQSLSSLPIRSVRVGRDKISNISRGVCYLEMNNVSDAMYLHNALLSEKLIIDDKMVYVLYSKSAAPTNSSPNSNSISKAGDAAVAAAQWSHQKSDAKQYTLADVPKLAEYSAALYAKSSEEKEAYIKHYTEYYTKTINDGGAIPNLDISDCTPAQTGFQSSSSTTSEEGSSIGNVMMACAEAPSGNGDQTYPVPDVSMYQYDSTSGYYYDPFTTLYYDAASQYYFNSKLNKFLYWDGVKKTYFCAPTSNGDTQSIVASPVMANTAKVNNAVIVGSSVTISAAATVKPVKSPLSTETPTPQPCKPSPPVEEETKKPKHSDDKVKVAKRIAKDMEKWAKTLNQKKEIAKQNTIMYENTISMQTQGAADIGYAVLGRKDSVTSQQNMFLSPTSSSNMPFNKSDSLVAEYGHGSDSDEENNEELQQDDRHVDWSKMACLLCKRQFPNEETLLKHQQMSDLHKQNLEAWYQSVGISFEDASVKSNQYRDRAKERRTKYNEPDIPQKSRLKESYMKSRGASVNYEQPNQMKIGCDNLGNKLLQKMGWQEGMGLGKSNQGMTDIIQAKARPLTAGLGSRTQGVTPGPGETYKECVKKMMRSRYDETDLR